MMKPGWRTISGFRSGLHFEAQQAWLTKQVDSGLASSEPVIRPYLDGAFRETWYRDTKNRRWRLVLPDPPFGGFFERVKPTLTERLRGFS